jgi:hypothetical protein
METRLGAPRAALFWRLVGTDVVKRAGVVAQPIQMAADAPVVRLYLVDDDPNTSRVFRSVIRLFRVEDDFREIADSLFSKQIEAVYRNSDIDEIEWLFVYRAASNVIPRPRRLRKPSPS